jgi:hypothetical protein
MHKGKKDIRSQRETVFGLSEDLIRNKQMSIPMSQNELTIRVFSEQTQLQSQTKAQCPSRYLLMSSLSSISRKSFPLLLVFVSA